MASHVAATRESMRFEEFHAFLDKRPDTERWELVDGEPVMMINVTRARSLITLNIATALHPLARRRGCETHSADFFASGGEQSGFLAVPDVFVRREKLDANSRRADDPVIIVEVLSPSTIRHDRVRKFDRYTAIESVTQIVLVYQDEIRVESFVRRARTGRCWSSATSMRRLPSPSSKPNCGSPTSTKARRSPPELTRAAAASEKSPAANRTSW